MGHPQHEAARRQPFGYICRACSQCCRHNYIPVNPYEVARLARYLDVSTTRFLATYTDQDGTILKRDAEDACVFLSDLGCRAHAERPLVCRLYPLGRQVAPDGSEVWSYVTPHPDSQGIFHTNGTIADFIATQGAEPFLQAADDYAEWVRAARSAFVANDELRGVAADDLIDMDATIAAYCAGRPEPVSIEARRQLHLRILYRTIGRHRQQETASR